MVDVVVPGRDVGSQLEVKIFGYLVVLKPIRELLIKKMQHNYGLLP